MRRGGLARRGHGALEMVERVGEIARGLAHARAQGRVGGRPSVMTPERIAAAVKMRAEEHSVAHIAKVLGVGASSVSRALAKVDDEAEATVSP